MTVKLCGHALLPLCDVPRLKAHTFSKISKVEFNIYFMMDPKGGLRDAPRSLFLKTVMQIIWEQLGMMTCGKSWTRHWYLILFSFHGLGLGLEVCNFDRTACSDQFLWVWTICHICIEGALKNQSVAYSGSQSLHQLLLFANLWDTHNVQIL